MQSYGPRAGIEDAHPPVLGTHLRRHAGARRYSVRCGEAPRRRNRDSRKHYAPFVRELRERVRSLMESQGGIAAFGASAEPINRKLRPVQ